MNNPLVSAGMVVTDADRVDPANFWPEAEKPRCPSCKDRTEDWWNYCAMCGWHLASGEKPK